MSGKNATFASEFLALVLNGTAMSPGSVAFAINATSSPATNLYVALHTADPTTGNQTTSEVSYTGYARATVARTSSGWTVTSNSVSPTSTISFAACTGGSATASYWSVGVASSGAGAVLWGGPISPTISISNGVTPQLTTASTITET
jgi:hypothetical protein